MSTGTLVRSTSPQPAQVRVQTPDARVAVGSRLATRYLGTPPAPFGFAGIRYFKCQTRLNPKTSTYKVQQLMQTSSLPQQIRQVQLSVCTLNRAFQPSQACPFVVISTCSSRDKLLAHHGLIEPGPQNNLPPSFPFYTVLSRLFFHRATLVTPRRQSLPPSIESTSDIVNHVVQLR